MVKGGIRIRFLPYPIRMHPYLQQLRGGVCAVCVSASQVRIGLGGHACSGFFLCEHFMCHATSSISANAGALKPACSRKGACVRACVLVRRQQPDRTGTAQDMPCSSDIRHRQGRCVRPERLIRAVLAATGAQTI